MSRVDPVIELLQKYGEDPRDPKVMWSVQGTRVISHKALERMASAAGVYFEKPQILRAERDEAVILVYGGIGEDFVQWSIGEALVNVNYRITGKMAAYVYAMAEKRAKDRVILKLLNLHGWAYSQDEADDFDTSRAPGKDAGNAPENIISGDDPPEAAHFDKPAWGRAGAPDISEDQQFFLSGMKVALAKCQTRADIAECTMNNRKERIRLGINDGGAAWKHLRIMINAREKEIEDEFNAVLAARSHETILDAGE
jgi:hypothetical protein